MATGMRPGQTMRAKIFITYHKPAHIVNSDILEPIQVGGGADLTGCRIRDNSGRNISTRNDSYCEMTAAYWAWQNTTDLDYIGLLHYRRFLDFSQVKRSLDEWGVSNCRSFTTDFNSRYGLNDTSIQKTLQGVDLILPRPWSVRTAGFRNLYEHYARAPFHHEADLRRCQEELERNHPQVLPHWHRVLQADSGWFNNMFVMRTEIFQAYCAWLFPLLASLETQIPLHTYGQQERRVLGYLAERLLNAWLGHYLEAHPQTIVRELERIFVNDPRPKLWDPPRPTSMPEPISVVVACDDHYTPHLGALIASIFDNLNAGTSVELLILDGGISGDNQTMLKRLVPSNSSLHFIPMHDEFTAAFTHMHFSRATFYRLTLDRILPSRKRVIYIDCDTIVLGDLSELWEIDIGRSPVAAVHDYIMESFCRSQTLSADFTGSQPARTYLQNYVGIAAEHTNQYFQAGVLILNLEEIRARGVGEAMIGSLQARKYWFLDQDVLNQYFCGQHKTLPPEWNVITMIDEISSHLGTDRAEELQRSRSHAKLIHYAGYEAKPWVNPEAPLAHYYFHYLRRTFWYEQVIHATRGARNTGQRHHWEEEKRSWIWRPLRRLWRKLPVRARQIGNPVAYALRRRLLGS